MVRAFQRGSSSHLPEDRRGQARAAAPLRRVDSGGALPADLAFITPERLTPLFILVDGGREIGRIRGYPGDDHFWGLLGVLMTKLDDAQKSGGEAIPPENSTRKAR